MSAQIQIPFANVAGFIVNMNSLVALDVSHYEQGKEGRTVVIHLVGTHEHYFEGERADAAYLWYLSITGQARIVGPVLAPGLLGGQ